MLSPDSLFSLCSSAALVAWAALAASVFLPAIRRYVWPATGLALPALFAVAYVGALVAGLSKGGGGGFGSIAEVRQLFADDHALTAGWIHYLAFDLIVGTLIARDAARSGVSAVFVVPALALTFLFGPAGFLAYFVVRLAKGGFWKESFS
ncbi:abscisic acid-deficient protein Aba4 family protein [Methylopila sp. M107]|uniref:abscisic acid-deficient protein Aba4 family protein n=1 Tax=Methylopila sp. M107 TaxID=1101190 RepID=UPI00037BD1D1|nr:abscisic acid-deficient protein Aba4 family protein [Methylopila sp. M107]